MNHNSLKKADDAVVSLVHIMAPYIKKNSVCLCNGSRETLRVQTVIKEQIKQTSSIMSTHGSKAQSEATERDGAE